MNDSPLQLPNCWQELQRAARAARQQAWAPYSRFPVGAAILTDCGRIFVGCNVENSSSGLTICAERTAVGAAVSQGFRSFSAIWISLAGMPLPCGACRQVLAEFQPDLLLILDQVDRDDQLPPELLRLSALLPRPFRLRLPDHS